MFFVITFVVCVLFGYGVGDTSNGMTTGRVATNFWTGPLSAALGGVIGLVTGLIYSGVGSYVFGGAVVGLIAGLLGLGLARRKRHRPQ